jgi:hypothetical protein
VNHDREAIAPVAKLLLGQKEIELRSWEHASVLIVKALEKRNLFTLKLNDENEMSVMTYDQQDIYLGLNSGQRSAAWFSQPYTDQGAVIDSFRHFYKESNLPDELLNGCPEWREASRGSPLQLALLVLAGLILIGLPIYFLLIR